MYTVKNIIKNDDKFLSIYFLNTFFLIFIFNLLIDGRYIFYPLLISIFFFVVYMFIMYLVHKDVDNNKENLKIKNFEPTYSKDFKDKLYLDVIKDLHFDYNKRINRLVESNKMNSYMFSQFIHNMKTSVAIIELASKSSNKNAFDDIVAENNKLKEQLEQSLNVLRLEEFSQDYMPRKNDLAKIVKNAINSNKTNFIYNKTFPKLNCEPTFILTDEKWCGYMINQVISNAIKYSKENGTITFNIINENKNVVLEIIDEGIGIPSKDLKRVFDLFYTGDNGRNNKNSTGIGLAMVKNVAAFLQVDVNIYSKQGNGTKVEFVFYSD